MFLCVRDGRLLENELTQTQKRHTATESQLREQLEELQKETDRQQKLISQVTTLQGHLQRVKVMTVFVKAKTVPRLKIIE